MPNADSCLGKYIFYGIAEPSADPIIELEYQTDSKTGALTITGALWAKERNHS